MLLYVFMINAIAFACTGKVDITVSFSKNYFLEKCIRHMVVFACWDSFEKVEFFRKDLLSNMRVSYVPIKEDLAMSAILKVNYYKVGIMLDLDCPRSESILHQFTENRLRYNESYFWLMISKMKSVPTEILRHLPLSVATEITVALQRVDSYVLYDVYNPSHQHGGSLNVTYVGYWTTTDGLRNELTQYKYERRQNFNKLSLNFSINVLRTAQLDFETYVSTPINHHLDTIPRFSYAVMMQLVEMYNLSMHLLKADTWGYLVNGTQTGILAQFLRGEVDIAIPPFQFKDERMDVVDYTVQTYLARPVFIFRHPKSSDMHNAFLMSFEENAWYMILVVAIVYWLMLFVTVRSELYFYDYPQNCTLDTYPASETALIATAALCQQGLSDGPRIYSGRIVFLSLFLWALLLFQFYSAAIVGSLLAESPRFINTLKDLSDSNMAIGIEDIEYNYDYFATTSDPVAKELHEKKIQPNRKRKVAPYFKPTEGLSKVQKGGFAYQIDSVTAYKIITDTFSEDEICDLSEVTLIPPKHLCSVVNKHSPFKKMVTYGLRKVVERGMLGHLKNVWQVKRPECPESHNSMPLPVALVQFFPALFYLFMGIAIAVFIMLIEIYVERRSRRRRGDFVQMTYLMKYQRH